MGLAEIIFSTIIFIIIWFIVFKLMLMYDKKQPLKNIGNRIEEQDKKTFNIFGKRVKAGKVVEEEDEPEPENVDALSMAMEQDGITEPKKPKPKKSTKKKVVKKAVKKTTKKKK